MAGPALIPSLPFIMHSQRWALTGNSVTELSAVLSGVRNSKAAHVGFTHHFKTRSNTTDFYYQQRFNASDSEDALTVEEQLSSRNKTTPSGEVKKPWTIPELSALLGLDDLLKEEVIKLSNGETRRMLIAEALIGNPEILVLDQPLTGLDIRSRGVFGDMLLAMSAHPLTIVVTVNPWEIPSGVTHVAVILDGEVKFAGLREEYKPENFLFTAQIRIDKALLDKLIQKKSLPAYSYIADMKNVTIKYGERIILDKVNWTIRPGERWVLAGPNGAGKSTLLSLINGDNPQAYANDIVLFDRKRGSGESIWEIKKNIGFVSPELYQYFPTDSACIHVIESGFLDTVGLFRPSDPQKVSVCAEWMNLLQIQDYANKLFSQVPATVQRLVLLARALVKMPALLILDEPTQGLDLAMQHLVRKLIDDITHRSGITAIFVSHYREHIPESFTHMLKLDKGKVIAH